MLTGQRLFAGATVSDTLAAVLKAEPDWTALPPGTPPSIRKLLRRRLEKDRKRRLTDAGAARLEIDDALTVPAAVDGLSASGTSSAAASSRGRLPWMVATAAVAGMAALAFPALRDLRRTPPPAPPEMRVEITTPATDTPLDFALSPDGRHIVYVASGDGPSRLWLRPLDHTEARPLPGTEGGEAPSRAVARRPACGDGSHGAGQHRYLGAGPSSRRAHAPELRCDGRCHARVVTGREAHRLHVEPNGHQCPLRETGGWVRR